VVKQKPDSRGGYSSDNKPLDLGDHEGDWDTVQLIVAPAHPSTGTPATIRTVLFYAHGKEIEPKARNHVVRMFKDPVTGAFTHPVVFVEHGGHEFWPSPSMEFEGAQRHGGDDIQDSYFTATPPNLGEVEHPLAEDPAALLVLRFNGLWGIYSRAVGFSNNPPPGPPLHFEWTYPIDSGIRWQLVKDADLDF
jgi:hypothetical protein